MVQTMGTRPVPEAAAAAVGDNGFQELSHHIHEASRLLGEREEALRAVYASAPDVPRGRSGRLAILFALLGSALVAATLFAWKMNHLPISEQSSMWNLPLTLAGGSFAASFVNVMKFVTR